MSKKYGTFLYGVNKYSAASTLETEATAAAAFTVAGDADNLVSGAAGVSAVFSLAAVANVYFGAGALAAGMFTMYAEGVVVGVKRGEALITGSFDMYAMASVYVNSVSATINGTFDVSFEEFAGPFWNPETNLQPWTPVFGGSDIWVKQAGPASPWSN